MDERSKMINLKLVLLDQLEVNVYSKMADLRSMSIQNQSCFQSCLCFYCFEVTFFKFTHVFTV